MQKSGESAFFEWKGKTLHQITSSLKKNKNNITDTHNIFLSNPLSHYRKEIASIDLSYGNPRLNVHFDELNGAGQTIVKTDAPTSCNGIDNTLDINLSTNKYDTGGAIQFTSTLCFSQEDTARRRVRSGGMPKKDIAIVDNSQASRKSQYYTSSSQYLYDRNKAFSQNERPYDKTMYTPSDIACDAPTIKPNNSRFFEQGAAKSGELIMRKKYDTITENLAKYQSAYGCSVANALAYASKDAGYMPKEHRGYPLTESPRFCFFEPENTYDFDAPVITSIEMGTGAAIVYFSHSTSSSYSLLYMVVSEPDGIVEYGTSSPIFITGLSNQTSYMFTVAALAIIYTSDVESGSTTSELLYTLTSQNNYTVGKNGNAQNNTAIIYIPSLYNNYIVNEIVDRGFENCLALRSVEMPSSIITIGDYAFSGCGLLQTITIPSFTRNIGYYVFRGCNSLTSLFIESGNTQFSTDGKSLLSLYGEALVQYCTVGQTNYTVPNSVKIIDIRAFSGSQVQNVSIPDGLLEINEYAFSDCSGIETIHIPSSVSVLETGVFSGCHGLVSITIDSNTIQTFSDNLFYQCYQLESINIPTSLRTIGTYTFFECTSMNRIIIPNVLEIGDYAFSGCSSLNTIIFNGDRPSIANRSFENIGSDASIYYYPSTIGWPGTPISGIAPTSLVSISGSTIVGETLTATHKLVEAGFIDESVTVSYTWYVGNSTLYSETTNTLVLLSSYESSQIRVSISYRVNGQYTSILSAYTDRILLIPGSTTITNVENGDGSILVYFETATNATSYVVRGYNMLFPMSPIVSQNGNSSPIVVSGLTVDNAYTFRVTAIRTTQYTTTTSTESSMSDSITVYSSNGYTNNMFTGSQSHLYIPNTNSTILPVLFSTVSNITHIIIENGVDTINSYAFNAFTSLQDIVLPNTLTEIGDYAFNNCSNLLSINIPSSVLSIGNNICIYCSKLTTITVDSENNDYTANNNILFNITQTELIIYPAGNNSPIYYVPSNITTFGPYAFAGATGLREIIIPNNVETLGPYAFAGAIGLSEIIIPNNVETLGEGCFSNCSNIRMILMNNGITSIPTICFESCTSLQSITLPDTITSIGYSGFAGCTSLQSITLPSNLTQILGTTFSTCTSLTSIVIPSLVTNIDYGAFSNCNNLASMTFNGNKPTIQINSFYGLPVNAVFYYYSNTSGWSGITTIHGDDYSYPLVDLYVDEYSSDDLIYDSNDSTAVIGFEGTQTKLLIPTNVTTISLENNNTVTHIKIETGVSIIYAIADFVLLEEIIINGTTLTTIESSAFSRCTSLTTINLPSSLTTIGSTAFNNCTSLTSINLPSSLSSIGYNIFLGCTGLTTVTVDAENTSFITIGNALFSYDRTIIYSYYDYVSTSYTLPDSVTEIVEEAFTSNTIIQSITMNNVVTIGNTVFQNCTNLSSITLSNTLTTIGNRAVQNLAITSIVIPSSVTTIGEYAISLCSNLTSITFEGNYPTIDSTAFYENPSAAIIYYYSGSSGWDGMTSLQGYELVELYSDYSSDGLVYNNNDTTMVSDFTGTQYKIIIPNNVTSLGSLAFANNDTITEIIMFDNVNTVWNQCFSECKNLVNVKLSNTITYISSNLFFNTSIQHIIIPASVYYIANYAFTNCKKIKTMLFEGNYPILQDWRAFLNTNPDMVVYYYADKTGWDNTTTFLDYFTAISLYDVGYSSEGLLYDEYDSSIVTGFIGSQTKVLIPDNITKINDWVFQSAKITHVKIGNQVTSIGNNAFTWTFLLQEVIIDGESLTTIGDYAFWDSALTTINIPSSVSSIGYAIFNGCNNIIRLTIDDANTHFKTDDKTILSYDGSIIYTYYDNLLSYTIPNSVTTIQEAFEYDSILQSINLNNVSVIGDYAFYQCTSITSIIAGPTLSTIGVQAFYNCSNLTSITFNGNKPTYQADSFSELSSDAVFYYYSNTDGWDGMTSLQGYPLFDLYVDEYSSDGLMYTNDDQTVVSGFEGTQTKLLIPTNVTTISLGNNNTVTHMKIESGVSIIYYIADFVILEEIIINGTTLTTIDSSAFSRCTSLTSINLPISLTTIGSAAFNNCSSLTSINLPSSLSSIGYNIFLRCTGLTTVTVDAENTSFITIGNALFSYDGTIIYSYYDYVSTSYTLPDSVTEIVQEVFALNTIIQSITMNNVVTIGNAAFQDCTNLSSITLSNTLTTIGSRALQNLAITSIVIPSSVTTIGEYAISLCSNLTTITFEGDKPNMESTVFVENAVGAIIYYYSNTTGWSGTTSINGYNVIPIS